MLGAGRVSNSGRPRLGAAVAAALLLGCPTRTRSAVTPQDIARVQEGAAALNAVSETTAAATSALLRFGFDGVPDPASIHFPGAVNTTVALDSGPGSAGALAVAASGDVRIAFPGGTATYAVHLTAVSEISVVDPVSGVTAVLPPGTTISADVKIRWSFPEPGDVEVRMESDVEVAQLEARIERGAELRFAFVAGRRSADRTLEMTRGQATSGEQVREHRLALLFGGEKNHSVTLEIRSAGHVVVSIDGVPFGFPGVEPAAATFQTRLE